MERLTLRASVLDYRISGPRQRATIDVDGGCGILSVPGERWLLDAYREGKRVRLDITLEDES